MVIDNKQKVIEFWDVLDQRRRGYYKPTETTEKQLGLINDLSKLLSRRDASKLIDLLYILTDKVEDEDLD